MVAVIWVVRSDCEYAALRRALPPFLSELTLCLDLMSMPLTVEQAEELAEVSRLPDLRVSVVTQHDVAEALLSVLRCIRAPITLDYSQGLAFPDALKAIELCHRIDYSRGHFRVGQGGC
jgi:hypothetical protein